MNTVKEVAVNLPQTSTCCGECADCKPVEIRIYGSRDSETTLLHEHIGAALFAFPVKHRITAVLAPEEIAARNLSALPALEIDGQVFCEGIVPDISVLIQYFEEHYLEHVKLWQLKHLLTPVDMSPGSASTLRYAYAMATELDSELDVVYAMDSIFEGVRASATGFLSGYNKTMQIELDNFIEGTLFNPEHNGDAGHRLTGPKVSSKVIYGFPDAAITGISSHYDLIIIGATGRNATGKTLFGSISTEVSKSARCPVLVVPVNSEFYGFKNLVYACDFNSLNPLNVIKTSAFAKRFGSQIHFIHVGTTLEDPERLELQVANIRKLFGSEQDFDFQHLIGDQVVDQLYDYAVSHRVDALVFVTHQRRFWENLLHRSVTTDAVAGAHLPILVLHLEDTAAE
jgi:nucleotide-binding universal stress UspA family protein